MGSDKLARAPYSGWVDDVATDYAIEFIQREREAPFLIVLGFKSPHGPRHPTQRHKALYSSEDQREPGNASAFPPFPTRPEFRALADLARVRPGEFWPRQDWLSQWEGERVSVPTPFSGGEANSDDYRNYARLLTGMDENIGRLLEALREQGIEDDTLIVFTSDNGLSNGSHGWIGKQVAYEESISVPFILRYPPPREGWFRAPGACAQLGLGSHLA